MTDYEGSDLEAMTHAVNYRRWIASDVRPYVGRRILEVGAGAGSFSEHLLETDPERFTGLEPSAAQFETLRNRLAPNDSAEAIFGTLAERRGDFADRSFDTIVYLNVLEHIEDDRGELSLARGLLTGGGNLIVYVPALPSLYGPFDKRIGHFRRYTDDTLAAVTEAAGFKVCMIRYRDLAGVIPWWISARILRSDSLRPGSVRLYDRIIPLVRLIDSVTGPPVGKNLLLVATPSNPND